MKIKTADIVYREDLYPRFEPNQAIIQKYSDSFEQLPPIKLDQHNILIDGFHRWKAFLLAGIKEIPYEIIKVESEKELKKLAYQLNSNHGIQLTNDEKRKYAIEMIEEMTVEELQQILCVSERTIEAWTKNKREDLDKERNRKIIEMYLQAWNTQELIAEKFNLSQGAIKNIIKNENSKNRKNAESTNNFIHLLYNIWNLQKQDNERKHFGAFPEVFMENLIYYHTEPLDIIFDPFGGGGTTVDVCKRMFRRYYVSDRKVIPGRENDIREHDIMMGLPKDLQKPDFVFLDPPYWKQAENKYSEDKEDLANMTLEKFYATFNKFLNELKKWKIKKIAIIIQPTQFANDFNYEDHIFEFNNILKDKYNIEMRYILPYSTQQYIPQMVNKAKEIKKTLVLNRDLVIWKIR